jgi:hypothetical protein
MLHHTENTTIQQPDQPVLHPEATVQCKNLATPQTFSAAAATHQGLPVNLAWFPQPFCVLL